MMGLKNIAGHDAAIFLFRFVLKPGRAISFDVNEEILRDTDGGLQEQITPLAHACCETLARYRQLSLLPTIMDGHILDTGEFEVMLSPGLGKYFPEQEKQDLFADAGKIANLLMSVVEGSSGAAAKEEKKKGTHPASFAQNSLKMQDALSKLAEEKFRKAELQWILEGQKIRPGMRRLTPKDLPRGVWAKRGYDHRGHAIAFQHEILGYLGRIVLVKLPDGRTLLTGEVHAEGGELDALLTRKRKAVFDKIFATVDANFQENFPD